MGAFERAIDEVRSGLTKDAQASGLDIAIDHREAVHPWPDTRFFQLSIDGKPDSGLEITFVNREQLIEDVAEFVQDALMEYLTELWPRCPIDGTQMDALAEPPDSFFWRCSADHYHDIPVGELPNSGPSGEKDGE